MTAVSGKPSELPLRGNCGRRLQDTNWEQDWIAGQTSPCCARSPRHAIGSGNGATVQGWWSRHCARDARKEHASSSLAMPTHTGEIFDKTQSQDGTVQNRLAVTFKTNHTPVGISTIEGKVGMPDLRAEHG